MSAYGAVAAAQQSQAPNQQFDAAASVTDDEAVSIASIISEQEKEGRSLLEMIRDAQEKADAQRETLKMPKDSTRYGDAPLEAYARLARAKTSAEVNSASGYARRRLSQFKAALRTDSENSAKIKAAINQLQKAINRGERKKRELSKEQVAELRRKRAAWQEKKNLEIRLRQELTRKKTQRMIRESGYSQEAEVSNRLAAQMTATQMELRQQFQSVTGASTLCAEAAAQQYVATSEAAAAAPTAVGFRGEA